MPEMIYPTSPVRSSARGIISIFQHTDLICIILLAGIEEFHLVPFADHTVLYFKIRDDSTERIEYRVENQSL